MGTVYEASEEEPPRHVALKVLRETGLSGDEQLRFRNEAVHLAASLGLLLDHLQRLGPSFELIAVDDGSRDGSRRILEARARRVASEAGPRAGQRARDCVMGGN